MTEKKDRKKVMAKPLQKQRSSIQDYTEPPVNKVVTKITADDPAFIPKYSDNSVSVDLMAFIPADQNITLPHRGTAIVDCGVNIELSRGYKAVISANPELASHGLNCSNSPDVTNGRVRVILNNIGKEILVIKRGDKIAKMTLEPAYFFEWKII
jgi:dUTPase